MITDFKVLHHSAVRLEADNKVIYIDPYGLKEEYNDADYICITHAHFDHFSPEDIDKVKKEDSIIVITEDILVNVLKLGFKENRVVVVEPGQKYNVEGLLFETIPAYNLEKQFHPKVNGWVGYLFNLGLTSVYVMGDTDITPEASNVECDLLFIPVGGTYTMDYAQAAKLANHLAPAIAIPTHYGEVVGSEEDAKNFKCMLNSNIECRIMI